MRTVSTRRPFSDGIFSTMSLKLSEPSTARLVLRQWREEDRAPFAAMNADPLVMAHFPGMLTQDESDALMDRCAGQLERDGYGLWAVQTRANSDFVGFVGLSAPTWDAAFTPCTEIGWRLARSAWGHGLATEAALSVLATAFGELKLDEVVSFTTTRNLPSRRVMQRIGMTHDPSEDFDHPRVIDGPLRRHVLYRLSKAEWDLSQPMTIAGTAPGFGTEMRTPSLALSPETPHRP